MPRLHACNASVIRICLGNVRSSEVIIYLLLGVDVKFTGVDAAAISSLAIHAANTSSLLSQPRSFAINPLAVAVTAL